MIHRVSCEMGGKTLSIETGKLAKQADGAVLVSYGDTRVLVTACSAKTPRAGADFFPLTVEFAEKFYAAGKIPGSFMKREGRPTTEATLSARMIDRPIRPLFPEGYYYDTQVIATILCVDLEADLDVAAAVGASAALHISDIPFSGPTAACRMGRVNGQFVVNPTWTQIEKGESDMEILIAGTKNAIMMVEGGAREVAEDQVLEAIVRGHNEIKKVVTIVDELRNLCGKPKREFKPAVVPAEVKTQVEKLAKAGIQTAMKTKEKHVRYDLVSKTKKDTLASIITEEMKKKDPAAAEKLEDDATSAFDLLQYNLMRDMILSTGSRIDGRDTKTVRPITVEAGLLPRTHGSSLFTRGETQVLAAVTLGTTDDEQIVDTMFQNSMRKFMLHYNFPPYSVGETGRFGGTGRREIGHGALAERSIKAMMPEYEKFPYTVRIVCETLESNGSSSMGSVCSTSMALMDAGVPFTKPVAGIAMGLIKESGRVAILTDILGDEDHLGDMDFKVAGTRDGITGIQMDIKIEGVDEQIMKTALAQAHDGRLHILGEMAKAIEAPRAEMSKYAPRIITIHVPVDKIREVIGSGGKVIKDIVAQTGCKIDINDDGRINIASNDGAASQKAIDIIHGIIATAEVGKTYKGIVKKIVDFGAFVGIMPSQDGLLHISEIAYERVNSVTDYLKEGDEIEVKVLEVDKSGKVRLSRKALLPPPPGGVPQREDRGDRGGDRGPRGGGDRGDRGGPRGGDRGPRR
ncbi:MAG: polyribonucleotide nucleotidyltransferase [Bdellovibrionales bacterium GWA1_52_35]|nr:MAG: polyribonucleotide nucleotidyltransferase [Bdellovibrionales bacterium GWA1_52_35]HCM39915.1 polyribonucleotide nucleotidyltransferase [Bdellovibrionales bacterium]